jgi:Carboxypeptidase regulatory-like domain
MKLGWRICHSALLGLVSLVAVLNSGCDRFVFASGRVVDSKGRPLTAASLFLEAHRQGTFKADSDSDGCFWMGGARSPFGRDDYVLRAEAAGYKTVTGNVGTRLDRYVAIVLAKEDASAGPSTITLLPASPCARRRPRNASNRASESITSAFEMPPLLPWLAF